jgi:hypothetical protein
VEEGPIKSTKFPRAGLQRPEYPATEASREVFAEASITLILFTLGSLFRKAAALRPAMDPPLITTCMELFLDQLDGRFDRLEGLKLIENTLQRASSVNVRRESSEMKAQCLQ